MYTRHFQIFLKALKVIHT